MTGSCQSLAQGYDGARAGRVDYLIEFVIGSYQSLTVKRAMVPERVASIT